jgi:hypothetical protein
MMLKIGATVYIITKARDWEKELKHRITCWLGAIVGCHLGASVGLTLGPVEAIMSGIAGSIIRVFGLGL